jgi:predicted HAD superfamily phosphohydrolase
MKNYIINGRAIEITLDNEKIVKVAKVYIERLMEKLNIDMEEALLTHLEDEGYMENLDQLELCDQAKENKSNKIIDAKVEKAPAQKTHRERTQKPQPEKEFIIDSISKLLDTISDVNNLTIENKSKVITFTYKGNDYKIDLTQKRKPKA